MAQLPIGGGCAVSAGRRSPGALCPRAASGSDSPGWPRSAVLACTEARPCAVCPCSPRWRCSWRRPARRPHRRHRGRHPGGHERHRHAGQGHLARTGRPRLGRLRSRPQTGRRRPDRAQPGVRRGPSSRRSTPTRSWSTPPRKRRTSARPRPGTRSPTAGPIRPFSPCPPGQAAAGCACSDRHHGLPMELVSRARPRVIGRSPPRPWQPGPQGHASPRPPPVPGRRPDDHGRTRALSAEG